MDTSIGVMPREFDPTQQVGADGKFPLGPVNGVGIAFTPGAGNLHGFPLVVTVNGSTTQRYVVRGPQMIHGVFEDAELVVDARGGGGVAGDLWDVTIVPEASAGETPRLRTDRDGYLSVLAPGVVTLFDINSQVDPVPFALAFHGMEHGRLYISPVDPANVVAELTAWDVSRYSNVQFVVDQLGGAGADWSMRAQLELTHAADGSALEILDAGTVNEFGQNSATPWSNNNMPGYILAGSKDEHEGELTRRTGAKMTHARFAIDFSSNTQNWTTVNWSQLAIRLRGLAW